MNTKPILYIICAVLLLYQTAIIAQIEPPPSQAQELSRELKRGDILVFSASFDNVWRLNSETGERTPYYQNPPETTFRNWYLDRNQQALYAIQVPRDKVLASWAGLYDLIKIDLVTGEQTLLWQQENLYYFTPYPPNPNYLFLMSYVQENRSVKVCLFSLIDRICAQLEKEVSGALNASQVYWRNKQSLLAFFEHEPFLVEQVDLYSDDTQLVLNDWTIYATAPIPDSQDLLVVAQPKKQSDLSQNAIGFYILNIDSLTLSAEIYPAPMLDGARIDFSPDGRYIMFGRRYNDQSTLQFINYQTWEVIFEMPGASLEWLSDSNSLIGKVFNGENYYGSFVRVNPVLGNVQTLFTADEILYFMVIQ